MKTFLKVWLAISLIAIGLGLGLLIVAIGQGASFKKSIETYSFSESYDGIESIDFDIGFGNVDIIMGDTFSIDARRILQDGLKSYVKDGTWYIREDYDHNIFGFRFSIQRLFSWQDNLTPKITITLPYDFKAKDFTLSIGAGDVEVEEVEAITGDFSVDAGRLRINKLSLEEESNYHIGTGEMVLEKVTASNAVVDCGVGYIEIEGTLTGYNEFTCGVGKIYLKLYGDKDDYDYEISAGIGSIVIDGRNYHNIDRQAINNSADNSLTMDCGIGNITVDFR